VLAVPRARLRTIEGSIPHPYNRPAGCPFHPRCPDAIAGLCERASPAVTPLGPRREASCFLYVQDRSAATAPAPSLLEPAG
jgi:oligopeptide/dipeptide ABC transporter ATP-binding protein